MGKTCWVNGCRNRAEDLVKRSFFRIPKVREHEGEQTRERSENRRRTWLANINRKDQPSVHAMVCSDHFISGKPADLYDSTNPDWAPTLKLTSTKLVKKKKIADCNLKRYEPVSKRQKTKENQQNARAPQHPSSTQLPQTEEEEYHLFFPPS